MGCGNDITNKEFNYTVKLLTKCILDNSIIINNYKSLSLIMKSKKSIYLLKSIVAGKNSQNHILEDIYTLSTGETFKNKSLYHHSRQEVDTLTENLIESEFIFIENLKKLRNHMPSSSLKNAINSLLIDSNTILSKLNYIVYCNKM